jgi:hypothetical protein
MLNGLRIWQKNPRSCSFAIACFTVKNKKKKKEEEEVTEIKVLTYSNRPKRPSQTQK